MRGNLFRTSANGVVGGTDGTEDIWVVDVDGYPVLVDSQRTAKTPPEVRRELAAAVDSIEFYFASDRADRAQAGKDSPFSASSRRYGVARNRSPYFSASSSARARNAFRPISPVGDS